MSWAVGYDDDWNRWIGYGVPAWCDYPACSEEIDRGLAHVCGGEPYGGESGCGLYFCASHLVYRSFEETDGQAHTRQCCERCVAAADPFEPKPEHPDWIKHQETDETWADWRAERAPAAERSADDEG